MIRSNRSLRAAALTGIAALALAACSSGGSSPSATPDESETASETASEATEEPAGESGPLIIGSLLPQTGSLAFLGPPEIAGVDLAIEEINEAGGVLGAPVEIQHADSSDSDHAEVATQSVTDLIARDVQVIIGAASSAVTRNVIDDITNAEIVQISPANTATDLSGADPFFFRTAPSDLLQGAALGNLILGDGHTNVGFLVFNEDYGTSLRDVAAGVITEAGGTVTYGNEGEEFDPTASSFADPVTAVLATNPDAIAIIAFDQTISIVPELVGAGFDAANLYFVDGNLADYSADFPAGTLTGAQGTLPGAFPDDDFQQRLLGVDPGLTSFAYAAESYDATILAALAAVRAGATDGPSIRDSVAAVSGADGGEECTGFAECAELLAAGEEIAYQAVSGVGPFNADNDPSTAYIGIYRFNEDNTNTWIKAEFGSL